MANELFDLDRFDSAILSVLAEDGRISITDLARRIGL
jgi:Lrp/AsnC family transcriptional regulator, leucine-responsive regulatory protein